MGFLGKFMSAIRVLQRTLGMPVPGLVIPFFVMLGGGAMGLRRPLVFLSCPSVKIVHGFLLMPALMISTWLANPALRWYLGAI